MKTTRVVELERQTGYSRCRSATREGAEFFFFRIYFYFLYTSEFVVPERKYDGGYCSCGEKVAAVVVA